MSGRARLAVVGSLLGFGLLPARASASTGYPAEIQSQLQLSYLPHCSICHGSDVDAGTGMTTKFGMAMVTFGLQGGNNLPSLDGALAGLEGTNSPYIADLKDGADPNGTGPIPPVTYGCVQGAGRAPAASPAGLLGLGLVVLFLVCPRGKGRTAPPRAASGSGLLKVVDASQAENARQRVQGGHAFHGQRWVP
jgi:hypothetical protein